MIVFSLKRKVLRPRVKTSTGGLPIDALRMNQRDIEMGLVPERDIEAALNNLA
jgi:hypothetical protein